MELYRLSAAEIVAGLKARRFKCADIVRSCLGRMREMEPHLHAMLHIAADSARKTAAADDAAIEEGRDGGRL